MWAAFGGFIAAYLAVFAVFGGSAAAPALLGIAYLSVAAMAVLASVRAVRVTTGIERRVWTFLACAVSLLALGDFVWITGGLIGGFVGDGMVRASYVAYGLSNVPVALYVVTLLGAALSGAPLLTKARYALDLVIAVVFVGAITLVMILLPQLPAAPSFASWLLDSALTLAGVFAFVALLASILESNERLWQRWEAKILMAIGLFVFADIVSDMLSRVSTINPGTATGALSDIVWMCGYFALAVAASQRAHAQAEASGLPTMAHARRGRLRWYDVAIASSLTLVVPFVLFQARYSRLGDFEYWVLGISSFVVAALVIVRSVVLTSENGNLLVHTVVDPLTGAYNHRYFQERVAVEVERARRGVESVSVVLIDIDGFSAVNERFGHQRGDQCLVRLSEVLRMHERVTDTVCRMGGDEFAIIMPSTDATQAAERAAAMQEALATDRDLDDCVETVSVGIAAYPEHATDRTALVAKAEGALYWARATGLGNVVVYDDQVVEALTPEERLHLAEEQSYMQTVEALAAAVDARDQYTQHHSRNVSRLAGHLATELGMEPNRVRLIEIAGLLHDVGKIGVPDTILRKPGRLTEEERRKIEEHPDLGQRILNATVFKEILPWVLSHHERWDGQGYPQGLLGDEIPYEARLLAVCDAYDAMVSDRPYRTGMPHAEAVAEIERCAGAQFDSEVVAVFCSMCAAGKIAPVLPAETQPGSLRGFAVALQPNAD